MNLNNFQIILLKKMINNFYKKIRIKRIIFKIWILIIRVLIKKIVNQINQKKLI